MGDGALELVHHVASPYLKSCLILYVDRKKLRAYQASTLDQSTLQIPNLRMTALELENDFIPASTHLYAHR